MTASLDMETAERGAAPLKVVLKTLGMRMMKRSFRVRPAARDRETDVAWAQSLRTQCDEVARKIGVELDGLRARHGQAADEALGRLGDDDGQGGGRDPKDETLLIGAEREMIRAEVRMRLLVQQTGHLARLQALIDTWPLTEV